MYYYGCEVKILYVPEDWEQVAMPLQMGIYEYCSSYMLKILHLIFMTWHVLQWLRSLNSLYPWSNVTSYCAAYYGHLHVLKWLQSQDPLCSWNIKLLNLRAIENALIDIVEWLRAQIFIRQIFVHVRFPNSYLRLCLFG